MKQLDHHKRLISITCILSLVVLFLPFVEATMGSKTQSMIGFIAAGKSVIGLILIVGPVLLLASNFLNQLEKYNHILSIAVPVICIIVLLIVRIRAKQFCAPEFTTKLGVLLAEAQSGLEAHFKIGGILALLSYIATLMLAVREKGNQ